MVTAALIDWWRRHFARAPKVNRVHLVSSRAELPAELHRRTAYVVGDHQLPKWLALSCPCGTGHTLQVNLDPSQTQHAWRFTETNRGPTLHPSVDALSSGRRCHFWLRDGTVRWCDDAS